MTDKELPGKEEQQGTLMNRRKLFTTMGAAGAAMLVSSLLPASLPKAHAATADELAALIGDPSLFRPEDATIIAKMKNEAVQRAVNLGWYGPAGDGVTDDTTA